ncbi:mRNA cleavage factor complex 2 protein [Grosmannia clavigera kw1407]|uniref:Polynucleotide 5'-hydroxyl-kinase GRC3 n=1 Tax=Grosmannia clavigera (strain kw1407 / UAMH 11150) TaxID=655863 RepID=F0X8B9_GROCL|nr:mRNA cleavage factor complex 2 protein [Grosmannia clavigera kw1407]EFX06160.1 mRNA cleavage factor complex 2 protein [Grosmannia clavigera kw1407]
MSIPGLGQIPVQAPASSKRIVKLTPLSEWRFAVSQPAVRIRLLSGTAERDGTELASNQPYSFARTQSKLLTWHGCELEVDGTCDRESVATVGSSGQSATTPPPVVSYLNLHMLLAAERAAVPPPGSSARPTGGPAGPRVLVCGGPQTGRTSLVRTLAAWATKMGGAGSSSSEPQHQQQQPCVVNADPRDGLLSLPGTLSAAVFGTLMDLETEGGGGWGGAPSSGPSAVPVKLPLVFGFGYARPADAPTLYRDLVTRLAGAVTARMSDDPAVHAGGLLIDTPAAEAEAGNVNADIDLLAHIVDEFSVNRVVVLGADAQLYFGLAQRLARETTTFGEPVQVIQLDASDGVVARTNSLQQQQHEACIREYFFGDAKRTLDPYTQLVDFDALTVYRLPDAGSADSRLEKVEASNALMHWTLSVMNASNHDPPDVVQHAAVLGFVYVADVEADRRKMRILAPVSGRLGDRPLVLGRWPEPYINLVG